MRWTSFIFFTLAALAVAWTGGCQNETPVAPDLQTSPLSSSDTFSTAIPSSRGAALPRPQTWADCELFDGVVTPATFSPESDPFDELYAGGAGFRDGKPLISESKPGDQDYNGGRWHLNVLKPGVDPEKYRNACRVEDLDLNDFQSTHDYFECPLLPRRGGR